MSQRAAVGANCRNLRGLLWRRDENRDRARIAQDVTNLIAWQIWIDRNVRRAECETRVIGDGPLGAILGENRDAIAGADAELLEAECRSANALDQRIVRDRLISAVSLDLQRVWLAIRRDGIEQQAGQSARCRIARSAARNHQWPRRSEFAGASIRLGGS